MEEYFLLAQAFDLEVRGILRELELGFDRIGLALGLRILPTLKLAAPSQGIFSRANHSVSQHYLFVEFACADGVAWRYSCLGRDLEQDCSCRNLGHFLEPELE
jgi:hypothetical protein